MSLATQTQARSINVSDIYFGHAGADPDNHFRLSPAFLAGYRDQRPRFGFNGLGEMVFFRTYSRTKEDGRKETFLDTLTRVVEGTYEIQRRHCIRLHVPWDYGKAQASAQEMFELMWRFKFLPPGRGLWTMGTRFMWERGSAATNNCFAGQTEIITRDGIRPIGELVGTTQTLLTENGKWVNAPIKSFGRQELWKLTLERSGVEKVVYTTAGHRWFARDRRQRHRYRAAEMARAVGRDVGDGEGRVEDISHFKERSAAHEIFTTEQLRPGIHKLRYVSGRGVKGNVRPSPFGVAHGIAFGDGTTGRDSESCGTYLYLCGQKNRELLRFFPNCPTSPDPSKGEEGAVRVADLPRFFRRPPVLRESKSYLYGWLSGYFAADGKIEPGGTTPSIASGKYENIKLVRDVCAILGISTGAITSGYQTVRHKDGRVTKYLGHSISLSAAHLESEFFLLAEHRHRFEGWSSCGERPVYRWEVKSVEPTGEVAEVFCPQVPETHSFALAGNILTGNCGMIGTSDVGEDPAEPFCFMMDMSMLGVGVGFDTEGADKLEVHKPGGGLRKYLIADSREGWVDSLRTLIQSYTTHAGQGIPDFDPSLVRSAGEPIKGFGGKASGPGILMELLGLLRRLLDSRIYRRLSLVDIVDAMNYIGRCVVAGNVRRTAQVAFGHHDDQDYCDMKNPTRTLLPEDMRLWDLVTSKIYAREVAPGTDSSLVYHASLEDFEDPEALRAASGNCVPARTIPVSRLLPAVETFNNLNHHRWASNNSIFAELGMDYTKPAASSATNGEPGYSWLELIRNYGRMADGRQEGIDRRVVGSNPCLEQSLESYELCTLCETFPAHHDSPKEYMRTLKFAYLYAKTVTLLPTHNARTNSVMQRNRRIGLSQSGIVQAFERFGRREVLRDFCDAGYREICRWDDIYSDWMCCTKSIKKTSVKPSGTVSLVAGATPGIHHPEATSYWRRVRVSKASPLVAIYAAAGYHVEPDFKDADRTVIIKFAVADDRVRSQQEVTIWEQILNAADYQHYWADNQVSCTVKFQPHERDSLKRVLEVFEGKVKGISFLPLREHKYPQAPYERCTREEVEQYNSRLLPVDFTAYINEEATGAKFCDGDTCSPV